MRDAMSAAVREQRAVGCGTNKASLPGITVNHAYALLGYDAAHRVERIEAAP